MEWNKAISDYKHYLKIERGLSTSTLLNYTYDIEKLVTYLEEKAIQESPVEIPKDYIQEFIYHIAKQIHPRSQSRLISALRSFFNYLIFENYRQENPMDLIEAPRIGRKLPETLSTPEIDQLIEAVDLTKKEGERNRAILETLYGCGLRVSELITLRLSDLFFREDFIRVTGKGSKQRFVPISPSTKRYIQLYLEHVRKHQNIAKEAEDTLFLNRRGKQLTRAMIFTIIRQLSEKSGLKKKVSPHTFRHSFATHLLENGADLRAIQQMMGHESITTTEIYIHMDRTHLKQVIEQFHPRR